VLKYVATREKQKVEALAEVWREYSRSLAEWVKTCRQLERLWRELGQAQSDIPSKGDGNGR
jgi:hypothetical protein